MAELGADYSWARPGGAAFAAAGVKAVGRYLASDGRGITAAEYQDLKAHGIGVWLVREGAASGMLGGFAQGVADAKIAAAQIAAVGLPADSLVYAAADWDVSTAQFPVCDAYLQGFASVLGVNRTGIYGGLHYLNHAHAAGLAVGFWRAGATSWDHGETPQMTIHFHQTTLSPPLAGTDHNYINDMTTVAGNSVATVLVKEEDDIMHFSAPWHTILWPNGHFSAYDPMVWNALKFWYDNGTEQPGTEGTVVREIQTAIDAVAARAALIESQVAAASDPSKIAAAVVALLPQGASGNIDIPKLVAALKSEFDAIPAKVVAATGAKLSS